METKIKELKEKLCQYGTKDLLGMIGIHFMTFGNTGKDIAQSADIFNKTDLMSPQKQYLYLAGLLMSTDDLSNGTTYINSSDFQSIEASVQEITSQYMLGFINIDDDVSAKNPEEFKRNLISAEAFTSYFDMGILRYDEQTECLIKNLYAAFDAELESITSLNTNDFLNFYRFVEESFKNSFNRPKQTMEDIFSQLENLTPNIGDIEEKYKELLNLSSGDSCNSLQENINNMGTVTVTDIVSRFGELKGKALIKAFCLDRRERDFKFYNESNPFVLQPLCRLNENTLFIVHPQFLLNAIFDYITNALEAPNNAFAERYKRVKAETVEKLFVNYLKSALGETAKYHTSVCEEKGTKEHDIVVEIGNYIIVAEVKATKVREPFFNPKKAYARVHDHFHSDSGIGGAYKQAITLKKLIEANENVTLFENKVNEFQIESISKKTILPMVLTLNQFGSLAVNTSPLLEKEDGQPYPWVCNLYDFENIIEVNKYLGKTPSDFLDYVIWRIENHRNIFSSDELDVLEVYYMNDILKEGVKSDAIIIAPDGPSLIDKIYFEKHGIPYDFPDLPKSPFRHKKIGVNAPCPCGSGKKFKKCCRGKGIYD